MSNGGVCRTAPATPGLLMIDSPISDSWNFNPEAKNPDLNVNKQTNKINIKNYTALHSFNPQS